jgi:SAM-dependent methyltransferase
MGEPDMTEAPAANAAQIDYWNTTAGDTWARFQDRLDRQLEPLGDAAIAALRPMPRERILDIGCGCGHSSLELAVRVGPGGLVVGLDVSRPMLEVARSRPVPPGSGLLEFLEADAQTVDLSGFDAIYSRFGVMFFNDPTAAFANIRKALKPGGRLAFVCWRPFAENPWMRMPLEAAQAFLPPAPPPGADPNAPGPFAFADADRVRGVLGAAGFADVTIDPFDALIGGSDVEGSLELALKVGPLGAALRENPDCADGVIDAVRAVMTRYMTPTGVRMSSAVWIVRAQNP